MSLYLNDGSVYKPPVDPETAFLQERMPINELDVIVREATRSVEDQLKLEDTGWYNLSGSTGEVVTDSQRITNVKLARLYYTKDPMARQAIRLWTDYTFGTGMTWSVKGENKVTQEALDKVWSSKANQTVFSARGQRKSCDKLLVDGEVFFAIFLGANGEARVRHIDPLEITEIISDADDKEDIKFLRRQWADVSGKMHDDIYRSTTNIKGEPGLSSTGVVEESTQEALVYYLNYNTISRRGNSVLLPALDWIKQYRRFLSSRIAVMLALARFAWSNKTKGGQAAVDAIKTKFDGQEINAGSTLVENLGSETKPIKTDTGAQQAYQDGRQIKLQIAAATGWPEQYFGDISIGNLATAKTVELPTMKMIQSFQRVWGDSYQDIFDVILEHNNVAPDNWYVDIDFPMIAPRDAELFGKTLTDVTTVFPDLKQSDDVKQISLMVLGVNDPAEVMEQLAKMPKPEQANTEAKLIKALKQYSEAITIRE